ncbi:MAG: DUF362 domain-containing protein [Candidatus Bathyarchaeota archaeon]|nr:MAG: DUF362 domain-containing protein [Candidatus Bathyarchaeota archaeon]
MPKVALAKGSSRLETIIKALNMIDKEIEQGIRAKDSATVLIKPNMVVTNTQLAATHADALQALLEYLQKFDNIEKIIIGEGPAGSSAQEGFNNYGYLKLAEEYPIEFMDLNKDSYITTPIYQIEGEEIKVRIAKTSIETDYKISITVPKTHETVIFTGAMKNFIMGSALRDETDDKIKIHGFPERAKWDQYYTRAVKLMHKNLVRLAPILKPDLSIIDEFVAMEGNGPCRGTPLKLGAAVTGTDHVATDAVAASLMGFNPLDIGYLYYADREGLGTAQLSKIEVLGPNIQEIRKNCKRHENYKTEITWKSDIE